MFIVSINLELSVVHLVKQSASWFFLFVKKMRVDLFWTISSFNAPISIRSGFSLTYFSEWIASCNDLLSIYQSIRILKLFISGY